jgi:O-antigen ligase
MHTFMKRIRLPEVLLLGLPGALTVYLAFNGGGFFVGEPARVSVLLSLLLLLRITLSERPQEGLSAPLFVAGASLGLLATWSLLSVVWSDAPGRAIVEFDRALMYWLVLVLFGTFVWRADQCAWALRGVALALWVVSACGFVSRALPEVWPISPNIVNERLSYPLTYWNAMGLVAALGLLMATHLACSEREPRPIRVAGAAVAPLLAATLVLTFSRGALAVLVLGLVVYLALARPRGAVAGLAALAPAAGIAGIAAYSADLLATEDPTTRAAVDQGRGLAWAVLLCVLGAGLLRALLLGLDERLGRVHVAPRTRRTAALVVIAAMGFGLTGGAIALAASGELGRQYDRFLEDPSRESDEPIRRRLIDPSSNRRLDHWAVAARTFGDHPLTGTGAGTFGIEWAREREITVNAEDAHSLYLEVLAELGLPGLLMVGVAILAILAGMATGLKGPERHLRAALFASGLTWAVHAGIDWDWELPAVSLWFFALGGMCLARASPTDERPPPRRFTRVLIGAGVLALAVTPALTAQSQVRLNQSVSGLKAGDCEGAIDSALDSIGLLGVRPEPYVVLSLCDARLDRHDLAISMARRAVQLDGDSWQTHYTLALALANAGRDPREAAHTALRLNPLGVFTRKASRRFDTDDPRKWRRRARAARLPIL